MIKIICVGKLKEKYWKDAVIEYTKRISKYSKIELIECNDYNSNDINTILIQEKNEIGGAKFELDSWKFTKCFRYMEW